MADRTSAWRFLTARLAPGKLGLRVLVGFIVVLALGAAFGELLDGVLEGEGVAGVDRPLTAWVAGHRTAPLTVGFTVATVVGSAAVLAPATAVAAGVLAWRTRRWRPVWLTAVALGGVQIMVYAIKQFVGRPRPAAAFALQSEGSYSFPSGHATSSLVALGILAWLSTALLQRRRQRVTVWSGALLTAAVIGLSRIYLGVHYLSDVLAAWALAAAWLTILITAAITASHVRRRANDRSAVRNDRGQR